MKTLVDVCIEAILADDFWRVQRKQLMRLPEHLANKLLESLLEQDRITSAQVEMFAPCATSISLAPINHVGDGGTWLAAISRFSALQSLHLQQITRLRDDRLALLVPFSSTLRDLRLVSCTRLTPRAAQHLSSLTCLTSLDLSGSSSLWATLALSPLHVAAGTSVGQGALLGLTRLVSLKLAELRIMDADCAGIAALTRLTELDLRNSMVSDAGVQELSRLTSLQCLDLTWTKASALPALSSLTRLHMDNCQIGGEVVLRVLRSTRFPKLREVHMSMVEVDEAGREFLNAICSDSASTLSSLMLPSASISTLRFMGPAVALHSLDLTGVRVTDSSWGNLAMLVSLQELELRGSNATNEVIKSLQDLAQLQRLSLRQTKINDGALPFLQSLKGGLTCLDLSDNDIRGEPASQQAWGNLHLLKILQLLETKVTDAGAHALKQLGASLKELHIGSAGLSDASFLRACEKLQILHLDGCRRLTAPVFQSGVRHLQELQALTVSDCPFISKAAILEVQEDLPLRYIRCDDEVLFSIKETKPNWKFGAALTARLQELAPYDESYRYSSDELLDARYSESVPQLDSSGPLAAMLRELEIVSTQ
ncbi:g8253 [Coccomyxa elongata]